MQIFGVLDVARVAGNFHISMHGLSLYVASQVAFDFIFPVETILRILLDEIFLEWRYG